MLEHLEYLALLIELCHIRYMFDSENASSADNQQERLKDIGWITGFVDGEGCFSVSFIKQPDRKHRKGYRLGIQVWCEFKVTQGARSLSALEDVKTFFGVGKIYENARWDNHKESLYNYSVRNRSELREVIIPFFRKHSLRTAKNQDFLLFTECFNLIEDEAQFTPEGLCKLAQVSSQMNRRKDRMPLVLRILNDHTHSSDI